MTSKRKMLMELSLGNMRASKLKNTFIILAIVITTLLVSSVLNIGASYYQSMDVQQMRLMGTAAHAGLSSPTAEQYESIQHLGYVRHVGMQYGLGNVDSGQDTFISLLGMMKPNGIFSESLLIPTSWVPIQQRLTK